MQSKKRIVLITGALRGIGLALTRRLVQEGQHDLILTSRNKEAAVEQINQLKELNPNTTIHYHQLVMDNEESIGQLVKWVGETFGKIDVVVNNAGISEFQSKYSDPSEQAREVLTVNLFGPITLVESVRQFLVDDGKIINVSSVMGKLGDQSQEIQDQMNSPDVTIEWIKNKAQSLIEARKSDSFDGWAVKYSMSRPNQTNSLYRASKVLLNAYTRHVLTKHSQTAICLHPGWVQSDMGTKNAKLTLEEGIISLYRAIVEIPYGDKSWTGVFLDENGNIFDY